MATIHQRQPRRANGFVPIKPFAHKPKHRTAASGEQQVKLTPWDSLQPRKRIDMARLNWPGLIYCQQSVFSPLPRLVKRGGN